MILLRALRWLAWIGVALVVLAFAAIVGFRVAAQLRETSSVAELAPPAGERVPTALGELFVQRSGPADGVPVVLVHGAGAWSGFWADVAEALAASGYQVLAVDLPPFGFSERSLTNAYARADQARRLSDALAALKLSRAIIVGHSFGAGAVMETALRYPDQLRGLVLICGALGLPAEHASESAAPPPWLLRQPLLVELIVASTATNPLATRPLTAMMLHRKEAADARHVEILQRPLRLRGSTAAVSAWLPTLIGTDPVALSALPDNYARIRLPTALIWGERDAVTPLAQGERLQGLMPGASLDVVSDVGHIPHIEDSDRTIALLRTKLAEVAARSVQ